MIDMTKQYRYYNGTTARILCTDRPFMGNLVVLSMRPNGAIVQSTIDGKSQCCNGEYDLVEVWEPKRGELVWFWDNCTPHRPTARAFGRKLMDENGDLYFEDSEQNPFTNCAPFTGTLPESFKGVSDD